MVLFFVRPVVLFFVRLVVLFFVWLVVRLSMRRLPARELRVVTFHHGPIEIPREAATQMMRRPFERRPRLAAKSPEMVSVVRDRLIRDGRHVEDELPQMRAALRPAECVLDRSPPAAPERASDQP